MADVVVTDNKDASRFEGDIDGKLAGYAEYQRVGGTVIFPHTKVFPEYVGRGVGGAIIRHALDQVRADGALAVEPRCSFVAAWIDKHPDYQDLVAS
ncbi:N-acetyltransferase [Brachybacterium huguangmaarense]|uniref:N-acetyltransferase n=1 Tax=Brachybacterium huguangmaarense TaxID=1652028 RepID=A0ABY6G377_9MICO|nr:GNAT family N-acetyltransferase [Brachybacterium huguangmaarense]UYG17662.1 N-acetyltransferase [Brachybacterium huguangmaarense]